MNEIRKLLSYDKKQMEESLEKYTKADLALLRKAYGQLKKEKGLLLYEKHHSEKMKDSQSVFLIREKLTSINTLRSLLGKKINELVIDKSKRERKEHIPVFLRMETSSLRDLDYLSTFLGEDLTEKLKQLDGDLDSHKKLTLMEEVIPCCERIYKHTKEDLEKVYSDLADLLGIKKNQRMKKEIHAIIKEKDYMIWQRKIECFQTLITKLNRVLERLYTLDLLQN